MREKKYIVKLLLPFLYEYENSDGPDFMSTLYIVINAVQLLEHCAIGIFIISFSCAFVSKL